MMVPPSVDKDTAFQRLRHLQSHSGAVVSAEVLDPQPRVLFLALHVEQAGISHSEGVSSWPSCPSCSRHYLSFPH